MCTELEKRLQALLKVKNVICITNENIALFIIFDAYKLDNEIYILTLNDKRILNVLLWRSIDKYTFYDKRNISLPTSENLTDTLIQFPSGRNVNPDSIKIICNHIHAIHKNI